MTDINPQWRIQTLTEKFGPCGIGWKFVILRKWMEHGPNDEVAAFVDIDLYYKVDGEWSAPVPGTGGSKFVAKEQSGLYVSDECFKMAVTDALSVAGKAIGLGADVYWANGKQRNTARMTFLKHPGLLRKSTFVLCAVRKLSDSQKMGRYSGLPVKS